MLVWRKGNINKNCLCVTVLCTVITVHKDRAVLTVQLTMSGFNLALLTFFAYILLPFSPFSELSLVRLALDVVD